MKKYLFFAAAAIFAIACQPKEQPTPSITLSTPAEVTVPVEGDIVTVGFTTNVDWTASLDNKAWSITPASGSQGTVALKVTAPQNDSNDPVTATLTIRGDKASATVKFTQLQKDGLIVPTDPIEVDETEQVINIPIKTNVDVKVSTNVDWLTFVETKGLVDKTVSIKVAANDEEEREGIVMISGAKQSFEITVKQAAFEPFFEIDNYSFDVTKDGGEFTFNVTSNTEWTAKDYHDSTLPWQKAEITKDGNNAVVKVTIEANDSYDARESYVKFTVPAIQDPVIDEETGEPTGEYQDHVERVYFEQEGTLVLGWRQEFVWDLYAETSDYSAAVAGDYFLVSTGAGVFAYAKADGTYLGKIELPITPKEITCDDAGNLVAFVGGEYDPEACVPGDPLEVYVLPADKMTDPTAVKRIINFIDNFWGYGLGRIRVTGDVTKDACVTVVSGGYTENYVLAWEVKDGEVAVDEDGYTPIADYVGLPFTTDVWSSVQLVAKHLGTTVDSGLFYIGYDSNYNLHYNNSMTGANWQEVLVTGSSWMEGYSSIDYVEWNGHKYIGFIGMSYYPEWGPSYVWIANIDEPAAPAVIATTPIYQAPDLFCYGSTTDLCLEIEGGDLVAYVVESSTACVGKIIYPAK